MSSLDEYLPDKVKPASRQPATDGIASDGHRSPVGSSLSAAYVTRWVGEGWGHGQREKGYETEGVNPPKTRTTLQDCQPIKATDAMAKVLI